MYYTVSEQSSMYHSSDSRSLWSDSIQAINCTDNDNQTRQKSWTTTQKLMLKKTNCLSW